MTIHTVPETVDLRVEAIVRDLLPGPMFRMEPIQHSLQSTVLRCWNVQTVPRAQSVILKVIHHVEEGARLHRVEREVVSQLPVQAPDILAAGESQGLYWLLYEDVAPTATRWTERRFHQAVHTLANLHQASANIEAVQDMFISHTPPLRNVFDQLQRHTDEDFGSLLDDLRVKPQERLQLMDLRRESRGWIDDLVAMPAVLTHGDYHKGNILYSRMKRNPFIIDWGFLHLDSPYFDLFQYLDATSPTQAIVYPGTRVAALQSYWESAWQMESRESANIWIQGYLRYATIHLLWILTLIHADSQCAAHPSNHLSRQSEETVRGIRSIHQGLHRDHPR